MDENATLTGASLLGVAESAIGGRDRRKVVAIIHHDNEAEVQAGVNFLQSTKGLHRRQIPKLCVKRLPKCIWTRIKTQPVAKTFSIIVSSPPRLTEEPCKMCTAISSHTITAVDLKHSTTDAEGGRGAFRPACAWRTRLPNCCEEGRDFGRE